jgi:serine/threonine protein kinase/Flp pilus assembly protein TadD
MDYPPDYEVTVFGKALKLPPGERAAYLGQACGPDEGLRARLEALLAVHEEAGAFLKEPASELERVPVPAAPKSPSGTIRLSLPSSEKPGDRIGRYKLLQQIGEGGCGVVYMAEQSEPVRRKVALKVIKLGMDTKNVIARFEAERQALALMDHPNIAKVLEAGATDAGRPFFVMELVRGIKITEYCDQNNLSTGQRLLLFVQVCQAIQHAHQKGIIHRDIKPSNILVTLHDGVPIPKVIDFGIAKATTDQRLTDKTLFTAFEQFIGTPAYMSPEQAEMSGLDVDTRSDIYALGVLLYELLTGNTPFDPKALLAAGLDEMRRTIREKEPVRPSTRLSATPDAELVITARHRQADPPKLVHLVRGDLDWIVMKCLEKDRTRRYETANGLARDLQRYLADEPISARPPSRLYQLRKVARRNKLAFSATGAVAASLIIGFGVSTWLFLKERRAHQNALAAEHEQARLRDNEARLRLQAQADEKKAQTEAAKSQQVAQLLQDMLKGVGPERAKGVDTTMLRKILDDTAERLGRDLKGQPEVEAEVRATLARTYHALGEYATAETMYHAALHLQNSTDDYEQKKARAQWLNGLGGTLAELDHLGEAEAVYGEALALNKALYGEVHTNVAASLYGLGELLWLRNDFGRAEKMQLEALAQLKQLGREKDPLYALVLNGLGLLLWDRGDSAGAELFFRQAWKIRVEELGEKDPSVGESLSNLGLVLHQQGRLVEAAEKLTKALELKRLVLSENHPDLAPSYNNLALVLRDQGNLEEAERMQRLAWDLVKRPPLGESHPHAILARNNLATILRRRGVSLGDLTLFRESLRLNPTDPLTAEAFSSFLAQSSLTPVASERQGAPGAWRYIRTLPASDWQAADFPDAAWASAPAPSGSSTFLPRKPRTPITTHTNLWLRREFRLPELPTGKLLLRINRNQDAEVFLNGVRAAPVADWNDTTFLAPCSEAGQAALRPGRNLLAVHCQDADCGALIDLGVFTTSDPSIGRRQLLEELNRLIQEEPQRAELYAGRASVLARLGRWNEAAEDLSRAVQLKPGEATYSYQLAPLLLETDDLAGYRQQRQAALNQFVKADNPVVASQAAALCLLLPAEGAELAAAVKLADEAAAAEYADWNLPARQLAKALAEYRQGRFRSAIAWTTKVLTMSTQQSLPGWNHERERNRCAAAYLVQAMAEQELKEVVPARTALATGVEIVQTQCPLVESGDVGREWQDWLVADILFREAKGLIESRAAAVNSLAK